MKVFKILVVVFILIMSVGAVCATDAASDNTMNDTLETTQNDISTTDEVGSFADLENDIHNANGTLEITKDYKNTDYNDEIKIKKDNFIINGNNHTIDGNNKLIFYIGGSNVTINNLKFVNAYSDDIYYGSAIVNVGNLVLNNVTFINNSVRTAGGAIYNGGFMELHDVVFVNNSASTEDDSDGGAIINFGDIKLYDVVFVNNTAQRYGGAIYNSGFMEFHDVLFLNNSASTGGGAIYDYGGELYICNAFFSSRISDKFSQIYCLYSIVSIDNATFVDMTSSYAPALYAESSDISLVNSKFINLTANISAGAIAIKEGGNLYIKNCEFINTKSFKNAGAINANIGGVYGSEGNLTIIDTLFKDTYSGFGGALIQLSGQLLINNSYFINDGATFNGGAIYVSYVDAEINNCTFDSNTIEEFDDYPTYGGAIYLDMSNFRLTGSKFINNSAHDNSGVIGFYDSTYRISDSIFEGDGETIFAIFKGDGSEIVNCTGINRVSDENVFYLNNARIP